MPRGALVGKVNLVGKMKTPEGRVKDAVRKYLKSIGAYIFSPVQMGIGATTLDLLCCIRGKFVVIEVKAAGKVPTPRQTLTMNEISRAGGIAIWGNSFEEIKERLSEALGLS